MDLTTPHLTAHVNRETVSIKGAAHFNLSQWTKIRSKSHIKRLPKLKHIKNLTKYSNRKTKTKKKYKRDITKKSRVDTDVELFVRFTPRVEIKTFITTMLSIYKRRYSCCFVTTD